MSYPIQYVDVFGSESFSGNPLAVITADDTLTTQQMQRISHWLNLSETTFLLPATQPEADYRVRIFTPEQELPFAGHPTLGSCHAWLAAGHTSKQNGVVVQESAIGCVSIRRYSDMLSFSAPPLLRSGPLSEDELESVSAFLKINPEEIVDAAWIDNGPGWMGVRLASAEQVLAIQPDVGWSTSLSIGVVGPHDTAADAQFEVRAFYKAEKGALIEDPVTGSLNASLGQWLYNAGIVEGDYIAAQGTAIGRKGRVFVHQDETGQVWVGGQTHTRIHGVLAL